MEEAAAEEADAGDDDGAGAGDAGGGPKKKKKKKKRRRCYYTLDNIVGVHRHPQSQSFAPHPTAAPTASLARNSLRLRWTISHHSVPI